MYLPVNLFGPGTRLIKKYLAGFGLTKVEKRWCKQPLSVVDLEDKEALDCVCKMVYTEPKARSCVINSEGKQGIV